MPQRNQLASGSDRARSKPISLRIAVYLLRDAYKEAWKAKAAKNWWCGFDNGGSSTSVNGVR